MTLDQRGKIAAAEIAFYAPILCATFLGALRHGFTRRHGWVYLFSFSLVRIVGAALYVAAETAANAPIGVLIASLVMQGVGLAPLLLATLAFITKTERVGLPSPRMLRIARLLLLAALILSAIGNSFQSPGNTASTVAQGRALGRAGTVLYLVVFVCLGAFAANLWRNRHSPPYDLTLLTGATFALAPLLIRLIYAALAAFAKSPTSRWSPIFGDWGRYLAMDVVMEYVVVVVLGVAGLLAPGVKNEGEEGEEREMERTAII